MAEETAYFYNILIFLISAVGIVYAFRRLKASPVLGYLFAGIIMGPHALKVITNPKDVHFLGEIGVLFLLFTLGLELPLQRLQSMKKYVFGLGVGQVVLTTAVFSACALWAGLNSESALLLGGAFALSSTAVVLQVMTDRRELATRFGRISFSVLIFQDLAVVLLLILTTTLQKEELNIFVELSHATIKAIIALFVIVGMGRIVFRPVFRAVAMSGNKELFMATTFLVVLGTSYVTEVSGLSRELGAFLAGILLAETEYRHQIEADIQPFRGLLLGVFFISVGMGINLMILTESYIIVLYLLIFMLAIKGLVLFLVSRLIGLTSSMSLRIGLMLAGGGEFVFVIFSPDVAEEFLPGGLSHILFLVVAISMALTPLLGYLGKKLSDFFQVHEAHADPKISTDEIGEIKNHIIIAGFGRVGQMLAEFLTARLIPFVAIDTDMRRVAEGRGKGWPVFFGDARQVEVLNAVGAENARAIVITLNQMTPSVRAVSMIRRYFPDLPVCVRIKDHKHQAKLIDSGAHLVIPETVEPTIQLAKTILHVMGAPAEEITQLIDAFRRQHWTSEGKKEEEKKA